MTENFIPDPLSPLERRKHRPISSWPYVRFWLLADIQVPSDLGPLYPRKQTYLEAAQKVR